MTQTAANSLTVRREPYPIGPDGPMKGLHHIAKLAYEGANHPSTQQWTANALIEAGDPQTQKGRLQAIFEAHRRQVIWKADPVGNEWISAPHLLSEGVIKAEDCESKVAHVLASFLSYAANAGLRCAVVGQSFNERHDINHVSGAVWIEAERRWLRVEPSSKQIPFGECRRGATHEVWIGIPELKKTCEGLRCDVGAPKPLRSAEFITISGLPEDIEPAMALTTLGDDPSALQALADDITSTFRELVDRLLGTGGSWTRFVDAYERMKTVHDDLGLPLVQAATNAPPPDPTLAQTGTGALLKAVGAEPVWTPADEQAALNLEEMVSIASRALKDAWDGKRRVLIDPTTFEIGIEALPDDQYHVGENADGSPTLLEATTGQEANVTGTVGNPVIEIALIAGAAVIITIARYYTVKAVCEAATGVATRITDTVVTKALLDCAQTPSAEKCVAARKAQADATAKEETARGEAAAKKNESDPFASIAKTVAWVAGGGIAALLAIKIVEALPSKRSAA